MNISGKIINNTYIIKDLLYETDFLQRWEANAIFSPNTFFFDLVKNKKDSQEILNNKEILSEILTKLQSIRNPFILKTIEFGEYDGLFYSVQQKLTGKHLSELNDRDIQFSEHSTINMMDKVGQCLLAFEWRQLSHNLLSQQSVWIPDIIDSVGAIYICDTFLYYQLLFSGSSLEKHFKTPPPFISKSFYDKGQLHPHYSNDLYSFGTLFYKLITGITLFESDSYIEMHEKQEQGNVKLDLISNNVIKDFIARLFDKNRQFSSIEEMYNRFEQVFKDELSSKSIEKERENTSAMTSISSEGSEIFMDYSDEVIEESNKLEIVEDLEEFEEISEVQDPVINKKIKSFIKTVFGFFSRFRKKDYSPKKQNQLNGKNSVNLEQDFSTTETKNSSNPNGNMQKKQPETDPRNLKSVLEELASHFSNINKERTTNEIIDIQRNNKKRNYYRIKPFLGKNQLNATDQFHRSAPGNRSTERRSNPLLRYLMNESNFINKRFNNRPPVEQLHSVNDINVSLPPNKNLDVSQGQETVERESISVIDNLKVNKQKEILRSEPNTSDEKVDMVLPPKNKENTHVKYKLWTRILAFFKKIFKFIK